MKKVIPVPKDVWDTYVIDPTETEQDPSGKWFHDGFPDSDKPLRIEIGSGNGHFLVYQAEKHPDVCFMGIEIKGKRVTKSVWKTHRAGLTNLRWIRGNVRIVLEQMIPHATVDQFFLNFPDPWPKRRHLKHRIVEPSFINLLYDTLHSEGTVSLATDHQEYFAWMLLFFEQDGRFHPVFTTEYVFQYPEYSPTLYEQRWRKDGRLIMYAVFKKKG